MDKQSDAIGRMYRLAKENGIEAPRVIGWDFPNLSQEQINVFNMHGYTPAPALRKASTGKNATPSTTSKKAQ